MLDGPIDLTVIDWDALSSRSHWTLKYAALPIALGVPRKEVATAYGLSRHQLERRLRRLRVELEQGRSRACVYCGAQIAPGSRKGRRWCTDACKMRAFRRRRRAALA